MVNVPAPGQADAGGSSQPAATAGSRRSRRRWLWASLITLVALVTLAVAADFIAKSAAQARIASAIQQQGFPAKPAVTIEGFPFLTQVVSHDIGQIQISARDVSEGRLRISAVSAVLTGVHLDSGFTSGTVGQLHGSVFVTFPALAQVVTSRLGALGSVVGPGLKLSAAGPGEVRTSLDLVFASGSATWRVLPLGGDDLQATLVASQGIPSSLLRPVSDITIAIPRLPLGVKIDGVIVTPHGVRGRISGHDLPFGP